MPERGAYVLFGKNTSTAGPFPAVLEVSTLNGSNGFVMDGLRRSSPMSLQPVTSTATATTTLLSACLAVRAISFTVGRVSEQVSNSRACWPPTAAMGRLATRSTGSSPAVSSVLVAGIGDINHDGFADVRIGSYQFDSNGLTDNGQVYIVYGKPSPAVATKFYVVNDASLNRTYEYNASGTSVESYSLNTGNTAPRGAASTIAGDKTWVVDANRKVYVYNNSGGLLGSWTAGTLSTKAAVEGIATNGTDVWIVDAKSDKVYKYAGAATRLSGSQNAASSFSLNSANTSPKDIVTDGVNLWVVNDSTTDKVFKYTTAGCAGQQLDHHHRRCDQPDRDHD